MELTQSGIYQNVVTKAHVEVFDARPELVHQIGGKVVDAGGLILFRVIAEPGSEPGALAASHPDSFFAQVMAADGRYGQLHQPVDEDAPPDRMRTTRRLINTLLQWVYNHQ